MTVEFDLKSIYVQIIKGKSAPTKVTRHGLNPATLEALPEVPVATPDDLDSAVDAAKVAYKLWSTTPYEDRKKAVVAYADALDQYKDQFRDLLVAEQGKPVSDRYLVPNIRARFKSASNRFRKHPRRQKPPYYGFEKWPSSHCWKT
jgi:acyl-CoA reductase-like NAD-dependent aldehyde dehydrogenase